MTAMTATQPSTLRSGYWHQTIQVSQFSVWLVGITGVALALRLFFVFWIPTQPVSDFWSYFKRAESLADRGNYQVTPSINDASYPPAYSIVLAPFIKFTDERIIVSKLINCLLGGMAVFLTGLIGNRLFNEPIGVLASILFAVYPRNVLMPILLASENLFSPLLLAWVLAVIHTGQSKDDKVIVVWVGILTGFLALTRASAYFLAPIALIVFLGRGASFGTFFRNLVIILLAQHFVMLPWAIRNYATLGNFTFLTSTGGTDFFIGNNENSPGYWYPYQDDILKVDPEWNKRTEFERDRIALRAGLAWVIEHPTDAITLYFRKLQNELGDESYLVNYYVFTGTRVWPPTVDVLPGEHPLKNNPIVPLALDYSYWSMIGLGVAGTIIAATTRTFRRCPELVIIVATGTYFPLFSAMFHVATRYHWPMTDLLVPLAAYAMVQAVIAARRLAPAPSSPRQSRPQSP